LADDLLKDYIGTIKPLLAKLGLSEDEAISSPMVTRAIATAQAKKTS
jgi:preprotein translocase subunit SecA